MNALVGANNLLYIHDHSTNFNFLVDSGAQIGLQSPKPHKLRFGKHITNLKVANGSQIAYYGKRTITVQFGNKPHRWNFTITDVKHPLYGTDFLGHHY